MRVRDIIKRLFTRKSNMTVKQVIWGGLAFVLVFFSGALASFYYCTGTLPDLTWMGSESEPILSPEIAVSSSSEVSIALMDDSIDNEVHRVGWNCVDSAWNVMRKLQWGGIPSAIVRLTYEDGTQHAILITVTDDRGWIFLEPQTDARVKPRLGGMYGGKRISNMDILIMDWVDILEFYDSPEFGITEKEIGVE